MQCLGPAFVKLGQWAATRRDLFPVHVCNRFAKLHDTARVHDWTYTHQALMDAFGSDYEERGLVVSRNNAHNSNNNHGILGSGCAAQVHIGTLHNTTVAVKVLHPHTRTSIQRDLALLQHVADFIDCCIPLNAVKMLSLPRAVSNFASVMTSQVDLRVEGENLRVFRDNFGCPKYRDTADIRNITMKRHQTTITFPHPESDWVSEHVLVEEYAGDDAFPISRYLLDTSADGLKTRKELAGILLRAFLKMVFIDNFIHADLHPG
jgi:aarF domain-containing kinase